MKSFEASISINATPEVVWGILIDGASYPEWDPYCERIEGTIREGQKIKAFTSLAPGRAFPVTVSRFAPCQAMEWSGGMPLGLFKGVRLFTLEPSDEGVMFTVKETFSGPMLVLIGRTLPDMTEPFQRFAEGLKSRAESR